MSETSKPTKRVMSAKEFLALAPEERPKLLKEETVIIDFNDDNALEVVVRQLTKEQAAQLNKRVVEAMPQVPTVKHTYSTMHTDPITKLPRRPGEYDDPNPEDPRYKEELEIWFNESAVWLGIISASESFGITPDTLDEQYLHLGKTIPTPSLLQLAAGAARVNRGLHLAEQLLAQIEHSRQMEEVIALRDRVESVLDDAPEGSEE